LLCVVGAVVAVVSGDVCCVVFCVCSCYRAFELLRLLLLSLLLFVLMLFFVVIFLLFVVSV